ncbi:hypothetical protein ASPWEDRAFT_166791 [Aspergillus wentii DTO 134E9]|uniref:Mediator of RNA polymerase II transcription subunit 20 n=1 Tax=Aspergillus wentii DTO 134E9 TaxID=1073089 RepID=A0A1L9S0T5_ASPWE|nr:uncharacterized protein ASPWEDRAFT_166791 [Aspergillus wentii DTO 134E9]OJJ40728.1 hypothetical protein ASPWEDRAFT_166791 [Aspergillus wentii DTO 134E9]
MPITGVFFVPSNPNASTALATVTERLHTALADEPIPVGRWAMEHKLMRDTPSCLPASASQRPAHPRYMQFLSLSYHSNHGFIYTSPSAGGAQNPNAPQVPPAGNPVAAASPPAASDGAGATAPGASPTGSSMIMTTVPLPSYGTLYQHFVYACQPFWCHRHTVTVPGGMVYDVGDFRVRIGDVRQTQPSARVRGTVVEVEWRGPSLVSSIASQDSHNRKASEEEQASDDDADSGIDLTFSAIEEADIDAEYAATATLIREFWARLGIDGAREAILVPDFGKEVKDQLRRLRQQDKRGTQSAADRGWSWQQDEDPDPEAGVDLARQFMEIFRFNR